LVSIFVVSVLICDLVSLAVYIAARIAIIAIAQASAVPASTPVNRLCVMVGILKRM
jgi:energy-coupling factor transporter transmembrane protein EcfT